MRTERTSWGEQAVIADAPARAIPTTKTRATKPQREVQDLPLFGGDDTAEQLELNP